MTVYAICLLIYWIIVKINHDDIKNDLIGLLGRLKANLYRAIKNWNVQKHQSSKGFRGRGTYSDLVEVILVRET